MAITVPTLGDGQEVAPIVPQGGGINVQTSPGEMGAAAQGFGQAGQDLQRISQQQKQLVDDTTTQALSTQLGKKSMDLLYDPKTGVLSQHGPNAAAAADQAVKSYTDLKTQLLSQVTDNTQREQLTRAADATQFEMEHWAGRHVAQESEIYQQQTYQDANNLHIQKAAAGASDPVAVHLNQQAVRDNIANQAQVMGWNADEVKAETIKQMSQLHGGVIEQMLTDGQPAVAKQYLADHGDEMTAWQRARYSESIGSAGVDQQAQGIVDRMVTTNTPYKEGMAEMSDLTDVRLRDAATRRFEDHFQQQARIAAQTESDNVQAAQQQVKENGWNADDIDPNVKAALSPSALRSVQAEADWQKNREDRDNQDMAVLQFEDLVRTNPGKLQAMQPGQFFANYRSQFSEEQWGRVSNVYNALKQPSQKGEVDDFINTAQRIDDSLTGTQIFPKGIPTLTSLSADQATFKARFSVEAASELEHAEDQKGSKLTGDEKQALLDKMVIKQLYAPSGSMLSKDTKEPFAGMTPEQQQGSYAKIGDIDKDTVTRMRNYAISQGNFAPSNAQLTAAYKIALLGGSDIDVHRALGGK